MKKENYIFGLRPVIEAIEAGKEIDKIMIQKGLQSELFRELRIALMNRDIPYQFVPVEKLNRITRKNHQGVIAFISAITYYRVEDILMQTFENGQTPLFVILDGITDVRNLGAIARTAECAGVNAIIIPQKGSAQINEDAVKTSAGALLQIPVCRVKDLSSTLNYLKESGLKAVAATEKAEMFYYTPDFKLPTVIIIGSEDVGISSGMLSRSDEKVKIPQLGSIASLNVSVAAGIIMYEVVRQRIRK